MHEGVENSRDRAEALLIPVIWRLATVLCVSTSILTPLNCGPTFGRRLCKLNMENPCQRESERFKGILNSG